MPEDMLTGLIDRVSLISSAHVESVTDIAFRNPRLVGGYNWIEGEEPAIAVPGESRASVSAQYTDLVGLPDVWISHSSRLGQLQPDINIPGYMEYADRESVIS